MTENTLPFTLIEPWDSPVDGAVLADSINNLLNKYLSLPNGASEAITMWVLHTYNVNMFDFTPRLCVMSPEKRCGKTSLLALIEALSYRVINVAGITTSPLFRSINEWKPCMLIDEADTFLKGNDELRGIINNGFKKNGKVARTEVIGKQYIPKFFDFYAPVALAAIGALPATITDRGIIISMRRNKQSEDLPKMRTREIEAVTHELQRKCMRFVMDNWDKISGTRPDLPSSFHSRAFDIWEPLYAIASVISPEWLKRIREASIHLTCSNDFDDDTTTKEKLLSDIKQIFNELGRDWIASIDLVQRLTEIESSPWGDWNNGKGFNVHSLGKLLKPFGIESTQSRVNGRSRRYELKSFTDAFERYLGDVIPSDCATVPFDDGLIDMPD